MRNDPSPAPAPSQEERTQVASHATLQHVLRQSASEAKPLIMVPVPPTRVHPHGRCQANHAPPVPPPPPHTSGSPAWQNISTQMRPPILPPPIGVKLHLKQHNPRKPGGHKPGASGDRQRGYLPFRWSPRPWPAGAPPGWRGQWRSGDQSLETHAAEVGDGVCGGGEVG